MTTRELSVAVGITEKDVAAHLEHIRRSTKGRGEKFMIEPWQCRQCGFLFGKRKRLAKPGRCPQCKQGRFQAARFRVG